MMSGRPGRTHAVQCAWLLCLLAQHWPPHPTIPLQLVELEAEGQAGGTRDSSPVGTPYWMAPEVVELKSVTTASDIWSVGCLAVELLTGACSAVQRGRFACVTWPASRQAVAATDSPCICTVRAVLPCPRRHSTRPLQPALACSHPPALLPSSHRATHPSAFCPAGSPPYFDLQPLSALYNIVQDPHPPLPADISSGMRDFLLKCFQKVCSAPACCSYPAVQY
jgi:serine/threonine protein kinase